MRPERAMVVVTREAWGCPGDQEIQVDRTDAAGLSGSPLLQIEEIKNPEDRDDRYELYYAFPRGQTAGLTGSLLLRLRVWHTTASRAGFLQVKEAELVANGELRLQLTASLDGDLKADLLYGKTPEVSVGAFSCPEAGLFDPRPVRFLRLYEVRSDLAMNVSAAYGPLRRIDVVVDPVALHQARLVEACESLLDSMERALSGSNDHTFMWDETRMTPARINDLVSRFEREHAGRASLSIDIHRKAGKETLTAGKGPSAPQLSQRIAVRSSSGELAGGVVTVSWERGRASF